MNITFETVDGMTAEMREWHGRKLAERCVANLKKHGFDAHFSENIDDGRKLVLDMISEYGSFGFAGSDTTRQMGFPKALDSMGKTIYDHWDGSLAKEESLAVRLAQGRCDCLLCSANAVTATGEIVNVDAVGNRVCAATFGPAKVVLVAGVNKIAADTHAAIRRIREIAAPMRAKSLGLETPCAETGICVDCNSPQRICRITSILHRKPMLTDISVVIVNQSLGF